MIINLILLAINNYNSVGTGTVILIPYIDLNGNGKRDPGELGAHGLKIRVNGGRVKVQMNRPIRVIPKEARKRYYADIAKSIRSASAKPYLRTIRQKLLYGPSGRVYCLILNYPVTLSVTF